MQEHPQDAPRRAIIQSAFHAGPLINSTAKTVASLICHVVNKTFRVIQLKVSKQGAAHEGLMDDKETENSVVLAIEDPQARRIQSRLLTTPIGHHKWTKMVLVPST